MSASTGGAGPEMDCPGIGTTLISRTVAVDGYFLDDHRTGMGNVLLEYLELLAASVSSPRLVLLLPAGDGYRDASRLTELGVSVQRFPRLPFPAWEQVTLRRWALRRHPDLLWSPYNTAVLHSPVPQIVTVHDTIYLDGRWNDPETRYKQFGKLYRRCVVPRVAASAAGVITVSEDSSRNIQRRLHVPKAVISVVPPPVKGPELDSYPTGDVPWNSPFVLGVGSLEERKNLARLLAAYKDCVTDCDDFPDLVLYGFREYTGSRAEELITNAGLRDRVHVMGYVDVSTKWRLYGEAEFFCFPSLYEGFGIPAVEAMLVGCPVMTSSAAALAELPDETVARTDPFSVGSMSRVMLQLHRNGEMRAKLSDAARAWVSRHRRPEATLRSLHEALGAALGIPQGVGDAE
ncbi:glycosyltransferase family 4 protein [Acidipropionibacterium jensenii]|nr:glycosyltransferase family 1 protein [Acidipropionibacterium jensenii]